MPSYRALIVAIKHMGHDEPVEGPWAGTKPGGNHVINDIISFLRVTIPRMLHQLLHEYKSKPLLCRGNVVI